MNRVTKYADVAKRVLVVAGMCIAGLSSESRTPGETPELPPYKGQVLYECTPAVKEVRLTTKDPLARKKKVKFMPDGQISQSMLTYDTEGYPIGCHLTFHGNSMGVAIAYDSIRRPSGIEIESNFIGARDTVRVENRYAADGHLAGRRAVNPNTGRLLMEYDYSETHTDTAGNWISRQVRQIRHSAKSGVADTTSYTETRRLKYL